MTHTRIWIVVAHYTTIKHNDITPNNLIVVFTQLRDAMEYIKGSDGNGTPLKDSIPLWLKKGVKPKYNIYQYGGADIAFKVDTECISEDALKRGGYIHLIQIIEDELR